MKKLVAVVAILLATASVSEAGFFRNLLRRGYLPALEFSWNVRGINLGVSVGPSCVGGNCSMR